MVLEGDGVDASPFVPLESREREIKIAAAQIVVSRNVDENVIRIADALRIASVDRADVVVFPERAVIGNGDLNADQLAQAFMTIQEHVCLNQVYAVLGMPFMKNGKVYNSAVAIGPDGKIHTQYDQISARADGPFTPGESTKAMWFEIDGVYATITIGDDLYWPELTELAAYRGMQLHFHLD